jgi:hypothetical protein
MVNQIWLKQEQSSPAGMAQPLSTWVMMAYAALGVL